MTPPPPAAAPPSWSWEERDADWGVTLHREKGVLSWWGAERPRPGVPAFALGGGGQDQSIDEFLRVGSGPYACPPVILAPR